MGLHFSIFFNYEFLESSNIDKQIFLLEVSIAFNTDIGSACVFLDGWDLV